MGLAPRLGLRFARGMFIDVASNGRATPAVPLRESHREGKRVRKRTLANPGALPPAPIDGLRVLPRRGEVVGIAEEALGIRRALPHGHVLAALSVIRDLGLERSLDRTPSRQRSPLHRPDRASRQPDA